MSTWDWTAIGTVASAVVTAVLAGATFWMAFLTRRMAAATSEMASITKRGLDAEEQREKSRRTPFLVFEFSDQPEHENLGAVGFRHLQSKLELLVSGTIRNVGNTLAVGVKLDIFHFMSADGPPVHEISNIHIADAIPPGGASSWSRTIGLKDLAVDGVYQSGINGLFSANANNKYSHFHVVFSCKNADGEDFSSIYCLEKIIKANTFFGNQMSFVGASDKYDPIKQFPQHWRHEIHASGLTQIAGLPPDHFSEACGPDIA